MSFCEIITNFNFENFNILQSKLDLHNAILFTDDIVNQQKIQSMGYEIHEIREYFGNVNTRLYSIYKESIKKICLLKDHLSEIKYNEVSIVEGLKSYFLDRLIFLEKISSIFSNGGNVIFLFSNITYFYFSIPMIANKMGYKTKFGVAHISENNILELNFDRTVANNYRFLYDSSKLENQSSTRDFIPDISIEIEEVQPHCGFFLVNNDEDFYLKPIYPILDKFKTYGSHVIFSFYRKTTNQLENRNHKAHDLSSHIDQLENIMMEKNQRVIQELFDKASNFHTDDYVLQAYSACLKNDRIARDVARILAVISVTNAIFEKLKLKSVVVAVDGEFNTDIVCKVAKKFGVPTFAIPPSNVEYDPRYKVLYSAEKLLISGTRLKQELITIGVDETRLVLVGNPRFDYIKQNLGKKTLTSLLEQEKSNNLIIVAMSRIHDNDEEWMSKLIQFCNANNIDILIKFHPMYKFLLDKKEICEQKIKKIEENCMKLNYKISYESNLSELLPNTSILITENSWAGVEASLHGKSIIVVNMTNEEYYNYSLQFHKEGIALYATNVSQLSDCIMKILNDINTNELLEEGRKKFNYEFNYLNDGKSTERIFNILTQ